MMLLCNNLFNSGHVALQVGIRVSAMRLESKFQLFYFNMPLISQYFCFCDRSFFKIFEKSREELEKQHQTVTEKNFIIIPN